MKRVAGILAVAAIVVGCGNEAQNDYVDEVNRLQAELVDEVTETVSGNVPSSPDGAAELAEKLEAVFAEGADRLEEVSVPDEVAELHTQLVEQYRAAAEQVASVEDAFSSGDPQVASQALLELQNASNELQSEFNTLIEEINAELQN
jgi:hypothetical protein